MGYESGQASAPGCTSDWHTLTSAEWIARNDVSRYPVACPTCHFTWSIAHEKGTKTKAIIVRLDASQMTELRTLVERMEAAAAVIRGFKP